MGPVSPPSRPYSTAECYIWAVEGERHLSKRAGTLVLDLIVAEVELSELVIAVLLEGTRQVHGTGIAQPIAAQVQHGQCVVEHQQVCHRLGTVVRAHMAPPHLQRLHLPSKKVISHVVLVAI